MKKLMLRDGDKSDVEEPLSASGCPLANKQRLQRQLIVGIENQDPVLARSIKLEGGMYGCMEEEVGGLRMEVTELESSLDSYHTHNQSLDARDSSITEYLQGLQSKLVSCLRHGMCPNLSTE
nr:hypothetical protein BaRGS_030733 [Batillaria attramentaria]